MSDAYPIVAVRPEWAPEPESMGTKEIMDWVVDGYDPRIRRNQADHSLENIWSSFERVFTERAAAEAARATFAAYLLLDAVVGNTDRHHENWGILRHQIAGQWRGRLAPSFDHASSLGRELQDERRAMLLEEGRVGWYSERGRGGIYWGRESRAVVSPLGLVRRAAGAYRTAFEVPLHRLAALRAGTVTEIVNRVPSEWMTPAARAFAVELIVWNRQQLLDL